MKRDQDKLTRVTCSIVNRLGNVGVFHINKLIYLFEYFYIKNFGERYTKETFVKLPHGPVISNYKGFIKSLYEKDLIICDIKTLMAQRKLTDDAVYIQLVLTPNDNIEDYLLIDNFASLLLDQILYRYSGLTVKKIEDFVYKTPPVIEYLNKERLGFKKKIGGEVLADCLKIKSVKASVDPGMKLYLEHVRKYPNFDYDQMKKTEKELAYLEKYRPAVNE